MKVGDKVRIRHNALDARSRKRGWHDKTFEVVAMLPNGWVKINLSQWNSSTSIWPARMLRQAT